MEDLGELEQKKPHQNKSSTSSGNEIKSKKRRHQPNQKSLGEEQLLKITKELDQKK